MLTELARQVALALHNVELDSALQESLDEVRRQADELQASRARIVAASDAARRQIERNLHDGAQQHLVALAVNVRLARRLAETDPAASAELLDQLGERAPRRRPGAPGARPRHLPAAARRPGDRRGPAFGGRAGRPADRRSIADGLERYSPEQEAAVYFCCMEALQNAGKHAGEGATASVRVWEEAGACASRSPTPVSGFDASGHRRQGLGLRQHDRPGGGHRRDRSPCAPPPVRGHTSPAGSR